MSRTKKLLEDQNQEPDLTMEDILEPIFRGISPGGSRLYCDNTERYREFFLSFISLFVPANLANAWWHDENLDLSLDKVWITKKDIGHVHTAICKEIADIVLPLLPEEREKMAETAKLIIIAHPKSNLVIAIHKYENTLSCFPIRLNKLTKPSK